MRIFSKALLRNFALTVGAVLVALLLCEAASWLILKNSLYTSADKTGLDVGWASIQGLGQSDPVLGYRLAPDRFISEYKTNALGYRSFEFSRVKPANTYRIICLGGSTTIGSNAGHNRYTYPELLNDFFAKGLTGTGKRVEVINAGVFGYHSWHSRIRIEHELNELSPDMYCIMDGINDVIAAYNTSPSVLDAGVKKNNDLLNQLVNKPGIQPKQTQTSAIAFLGQSRFYQLASSAVTGAMVALGLADDFLTRKLDRFGYKTNITHIVADSRAHGIEILLVNYPWIVQPDLTVSEQKRHLPSFHPRALLPVYVFGRKAIYDDNVAVSQETGARLVDPQPAFDALTRDPAKVPDLYSDTMHFTRYGNFILAQEIYKALLIDPGFLAFLGDTKLPSATEIAGGFSDLTQWPELRSKSDGKWRLLDFAPKMAIVREENTIVTMENGWSVISPADPRLQGRLVLRFLQEPRDRTLVVLPRSNSPSDIVTVALAGTNGHDGVLLNFHGDLPGQWTTALVPQRVTLPAGDVRTWEVDISLQGENAQLWCYGSRTFFPDYLLAGP